MEKKVLKKLTHNLGYKIAAILLAVVLWLVVVNIEDPNKTVTIWNIPIELINSETITDQGKVYSITSGSTAYVKVKGPRSYVDKLEADDFIATADFETLSITNAVTVQVDWSEEGVDYSKRVEILESTTTISVALEDIKSKTYEVQINYSGELAEGYVVNEAALSNETVVVTAPQSILREIDYVSVSIDVTDRVEDFSENVTPKLYSDSGQEIFQDENTKINVSVVTADIQIFKTKTVPINIYSLGSPGTGYELSMITTNVEYIDIKGYSENIDKVSSINISSEDVNITGAVTDMKFNLYMEDYLPDEIYLLDENSNNFTVTAIIVSEGVKSYTIKTSSVTFINKPVGLKATISYPVDSIIFRVNGASSSFDVSQVTASIDLSGAVAGTAEYSVIFSLPEGELASVVKVDVLIEEVTP